MTLDISIPNTSSHELSLSTNSAVRGSDRHGLREWLLAIPNVTQSVIYSDTQYVQLWNQVARTHYRELCTGVMHVDSEEEVMCSLKCDTKHYLL